MSNHSVNAIQSIRNETQSAINNLLQCVVDFQSKVESNDIIAQEDLDLLTTAINIAHQKSKTIGLEFMANEPIKC